MDRRPVRQSGDESPQSKARLPAASDDPPTVTRLSRKLLRHPLLVAAMGVLLLCCLAVALWLWAPQYVPFGVRPGPAATDATGDGRPPTQAVGAAPNSDAVAPAAVRTLVAEALQAVDQLRERFPDDERTLHVAAELRSGLGQSDQALQLWRQSLARNPQDAEALVAIGRIQLESGAYAEAEQALCSALAAAPGDLRAAYLLANALVHQGKLREAVDILEPCVAAAPDLMPNQMLLGQTYLQLKQEARAKDCFRAATRLAPEYANAYFGLATACARLGEKEEAARYREQFRVLQAKELRQRIDDSKRYDDVTTTQQVVATTLVAAGRVCVDHGDEAAAEAHWVRAVALNPTHADTRRALADLYERQARPQDALRVLRPLQESPGAEPGLWLRIGQLAARTGDVPAAERALQRVVELVPDQAVGYVALAELLLPAEGRAAEAAEFARQAVQRAPTAANYFLLSAAAARAGDRPAALEAIQQALRLEPGSRQYQEHYLQLRREAAGKEP